MHWSSVTVALLTIQLVTCDPLTNTENEQRLQSCGKKMTTKVYMGRDAKQSEAPWSVFSLLMEPSTQTATTCTGTIVSSRHILTATHCFADQKKDGTWHVKDHGWVDSNCKNNDYVITDETLLKRIKFQSNGQDVARHPEKVTLVNACLKRSPVNLKGTKNEKAQFFTDDFAIVDLYDDLTFTDTLQSVCVAKDKDANKAATKLDYFGYGLNPKQGKTTAESGDNSGVLRYESVEVLNFPMEEYYFMAKNGESKTVACEGDSGGGSIASGNGRKTIVGVLSQTSCENPAERTDNAKELYASVGYYNDDICQVTGICDAAQNYNKYHNGYVKKVKPPRPTEAPAPPQLNRPTGGSTDPNALGGDPNQTMGNEPPPPTEQPTDTVDSSVEESKDPNEAIGKYFNIIIVLLPIFLIMI